MAERQCALITGALGGIGLALCREFRRAGYYVIATDRAEGSCDCDAFLRLDVRGLCKSELVRKRALASVREFSRGRGLRVLINNAATQILGRTEEISLEDWSATLETNLVAPFVLVQLFLSDLEQGGGSVINIGSVHAAATKPGFVCYATSKAALVGMTRALAVDLGRRARVNAINPAATATPMLMAGFAGREKEFDELRSMHPLDRIARPEEVAQAALFLGSEQASFITGACLHVDGGIGGRLHDPL